MGNMIKVSICVPVFNNESYLLPFLDSVLRQSLEDIEVIFADNHSTDRSYEILRNYATVFPNKVFVYQTAKHGGPGMGRNLAFQKSHGEYIYWCDSDDIIHPNALEELYKEAKKYNADIVCASGVRVDEKNGEITSVANITQKQTMAVSNEVAIVSSEIQFWSQLFKRELVELVGLMPNTVILDDVRYVTVLRTYAKTIRFLDFPVYYWFMRKSSTTNAIRKELCQDLVDADTYMLQHCNPKHLQAVQFLAGIRERWNMDFRWPLLDIYINWLRENAAWIYSNERIRRDRSVYDALRWADGLADLQCPNTIYVNGFKDSPNKSRLEELQNKVFHDGCKIVVLSLENCDLKENPYITRAYRNGDYDCVAGYFALKHIYQDGGIYIDDRIRIINYFGVLKYQNAFFAMIDKTTYSDWIYGAPAENEAIEAILKTYSDQWDKKREYMSLSERISIILTAKYGIPLDGKPRLFGDIVSVFSPDLSVADTRFGSETKKCMFEHDFSAYAQQDEYVTIPRSSLEWMLAHARVEVVERVIRENEDLMSTNTGRLMMKIRRIGDGPYGPFLKKIFHAVLRLYRKIK